MPAKMTSEQFIAKAKAGSPSLTVLGQYVNNKTKILVRCEKCGQEYEVAPSSVMRGVGCPYCSGHMAIAGVNDLATLYPEVAKLWHPTRNGDVKPSDVKPQSNKKFWWLCPKCGGEWEAVPGSLTARGNGCPYCSGHRVLAGFNDLATVEPDVARQWHPTRNGELAPTQVTAGSNRKVWWRCDHGHEWEAAISSRVHGAGCPYCAGQRVIPGENDLATLYPEVARLWHPTRNGSLTPADVTAHTIQKAWWLGECGHEWDATVANMVKMTGCPICSGKRVLVGFNDLATVRPELAVEWLPTRNGGLNPTDVTEFSNKRVWWRCAQGHEWRQTVNIRSSKGNGCPYCSNSKVLPGYNDLATTHPELAEEWAYDLNGELKPTDLTYGSERKVWWRCRECGNTWQASLNARTSQAGPRGCPSCAAPKGTSFPEQALLFYLRRDLGCEVRSREQVEMGGVSKELDVWIPSMRTGYEYDGEYSHSIRQRHDDEKDRLAREAGIRLIRVIEAGRWSVNGDRITFDVRHMKQRNQQRAIEAAVALVAPNHGPVDLDADTPAIMSQYKGEERERSLASRYPEIAAEWNCERNGMLTPEKVSHGSNRKVWWRCPLGHEYQMSITNRTKDGIGCPICSGHQVLAGFNDLATTRPDVAATWHPTRNGELRPTDVTCTSHKKVWWLGECGHEWEAVISTRVRGSGCPICAGKVVLAGFNDLASANPQLAAEWHPTKNGDFKPTMVTAHTGKKVWWLGPCGHEWEAAVSSRSAGHGCPYCGRLKVLRGFNDLQTLYPEVAREWHPTKNGDLTAADVMPKSGKKRWWKCSRCGNEYECVVHNVTNGFSGCRKCGYKPGLNAKHRHELGGSTHGE